MGEIAALATSFCWSLTSIQFTLAGQQVGSSVVNRVRLAMAVLFVSAAHLLLQGEIWPVQAQVFRWGWLGLSGIVGLVLGDACLFQAFVLIGPRRSMLMMTLVPVISALLAWAWLGELLSLIQIGAILMTVAGIVWVVSERKGKLDASGENTQSEEEHLRGVLLGFGAALGQALGLVIAKQGLVGDFSTLSATVIRMLVAAVVIWLITLLRGEVKKSGTVFHERRTAFLLIGGALTGPFLGVWLSMIAVQKAPVGVASALMGLSPIILIPLTRRILAEEISLRAIAGTVLALAGASILFFV